MVFNPAAELLREHMADRGEKTALLCDGAIVTYAELGEGVQKYAAILRSSGATPGDRVLVCLPDSPEFIFAFLGGILAGLVPVPCADPENRENLEFLLKDCRATALFGVSTSCAAIASSPHLKNRLLVDAPEFLALKDIHHGPFLPSPVAMDAQCFQLYTSGSTGRPKGVAHRGQSLLPEADHFGREILKITPDDVLFSASKMHFGFGLLNSIGHGLGAGATVALLSGRPILSALRRVLLECRPTLLFAVPSVFSVLLDGAGDLIQSGFPRLCVSSGEALEEDFLRYWMQETGIEIIDSVGATETFHAFISGRPGRIVPGAAGTVIPPWEARLVDEAGCQVQDGLPGCLEVRGPTVAPGTGGESLTDDGWLRTGDMFLAEDAVFTFAGRIDDMFKSDGQWVSPRPIESALRLHPQVRECAVCARRLLGVFRPVAHVVLKDGISGNPALERDLFAFLRQRLPAHMCPVQFIFQGELPKTTSGKLRRMLLSNNGSGGRKNG